MYSQPKSNSMDPDPRSLDPPGCWRCYCKETHPHQGWCKCQNSRLELLIWLGPRCLQWPWWLLDRLGRGRNLGDMDGSIGTLGICLVLPAKRMSSLLGVVLQNQLAMGTSTARRGWETHREVLWLLRWGSWEHGGSRGTVIILNSEISSLLPTLQRNTTYVLGRLQISCLPFWLLFLFTTHSNRDSSTSQSSGKDCVDWRSVLVDCLGSV